MIEKLIKVDDSDFPYIDEESVAHRSKKEYLQTEILHFCGCGDGDAVMVYVKEFLEKQKTQAWGNYEDLPYMFLAYWADHEGFTEHGTTVRCSWLTERGEELLNDINWCLENEA